MNYRKIYADFFRYGEQMEVLCELCGARMQDIHHITGRGAGKDCIENLIALCRSCHDRAEPRRKSYLRLLSQHLRVLNFHAYKAGKPLFSLETVRKKLKI